MRRFLTILLLLFTVSVQEVTAVSLPPELADGADRELVSAAEDTASDAAHFTSGLLRLFERLRPELGVALKKGVKTAMLQVLIVLIAGIGGDLIGAAGGEGSVDPAPMAAVLAISALAVSNMDGLMRSCVSLLTELGAFADSLLPVLAAAVAATGAVSAAATEQVVTAWVSSMMIRALNSFLPALVFSFVALLSASASLGDARLKKFAMAMKKGIGLCLTAVVSVFSIYLSLTHILSGGTDAMSVRLTKAALSSAVPVVGTIISDTAETVLAGAGMMRNAIGVFGLLTVISLCALPFFSLLFQYLAYRVAALASSAVEGGRLSDYLEEMSGAYSLMLGMVGSAALMLFVSIFASMAVMTV